MATECDHLVGYIPGGEVKAGGLERENDGLRGQGR